MARPAKQGGGLRGGDGQWLATPAFLNCGGGRNASTARAHVWSIFGATSGTGLRTFFTSRTIDLPSRV